MCGRVRLSSDVSELKIRFSIPEDRPPPNFAPTWNGAPTDNLPVVRLDHDGRRSLVTTKPNKLCAQLHNRMPLVLDPPRYAKAPSRMKGHGARTAADDNLRPAEGEVIDARQRLDSLGAGGGQSQEIDGSKIRRADLRGPRVRDRQARTAPGNGERRQLRAVGELRCSFRRGRPLRSGHDRAKSGPSVRRQTYALACVFKTPPEARLSASAPRFLAFRQLGLPIGLICRIYRAQV
jgi:hypothetical protein